MPTKVKRKIIKIDEDLCNGCEECIPGCPEQALVMVDTPKGRKARMVKEIYCDGLGACIGHCPTGALTIEEREAEAYDDEATIERIKEKAPEKLEEHEKHMQEHGLKPASTECGHGCPSAVSQQWETAEDVATEDVATKDSPRLTSELRQWPVQLHLVSPNAAYFKNADLAIIADCVPFTNANFHADFVRHKAIAIGCPKLDDAQAYIQKIAQIISAGRPKSITVVNMEVPCCFGLIQIVKAAIQQAGLDIPVKTVTISIKGEKL